MAATGWDSDYTYKPIPLFQETFTCLPFSLFKSPHLETGDKIIMPASSFAQIVSLPIRYPWTFEIEAHVSGRTSHCGVLEFEADEGCIYMPSWMMMSLGVVEGDLVTLRDAYLGKASFMKLRPHETAFTELSNPKAILETQLRGFTCATRGDTISVEHNGRDYYLDVVEVMPGKAVSLIDTDCELEFETPLDYVEPEKRVSSSRVVLRKDADHSGEEGEGERVVFVPFSGKGHRTDRISAAAAAEVVLEKKGGKGKERCGGEFKAFTGRGRVLGGPSI